MLQNITTDAKIFELEYRFPQFKCVENPGRYVVGTFTHHAGVVALVEDPLVAASADVLRAIYAEIVERRLSLDNLTVMAPDIRGRLELSYYTSRLERSQLQ
ncbi:hypothetical protein RugamoR57_37250 [Duganella caerulea]